MAKVLSTPAYARKLHLQEQKHGIGVRILIIDDDLAGGSMLMLLLCDLGHSVSVASNLEQAYAKMAEERPELIICDFNLSGGESGADVWASLPDLAPQAKMIMMSGYSAETIGASCAGSDAMELYRYMEKPIDFDALSAAIESMASR